MTTRVSIPGLDAEKIEAYLKSVLGPGVTLLDLTPLDAAKDVKGFGYGVPVRVDYQTAGRERRSAVLHTMSPGPFGHEHMPDRAQILLWSHEAFNRLPRHVQSLDVAAFEPGGSLISLGRVEEFCLLTEYAEGRAYAQDLERLRAPALRRISISTALRRCATTWPEFTPCAAAIRVLCAPES